MRVAASKDQLEQDGPNEGFESTVWQNHLGGILAVELKEDQGVHAPFQQAVVNSVWVEGMEA